MGSVAEGDYPLITIYGKDVAALVIFIIGFTGVCCNTTIALFTRKLPTMNNPFGRLLASQATGETVICCIFAFYVTPVMWTDSPTLIFYSYVPGWISLFCYDICTWSHFFISINRFVAICTPMRYEIVFSERNTWIIIIFTWITAVVYGTTMHYLIVSDCAFVFDAPHWAFLFETTNPACEDISWYSDFVRDTSLIVLIGIIDFITVVNVHRLNKVSAAVSQAQVARRKREINFLKQAILQMLVFVVELSTYFVLCAYFFDNRWIFWILTSLAWICVHTTDGLIILFFNKEFRRLISSPIRKLCFSEKDTTIVVNNTTGTTPLSVIQPSQASSH